MFSDGLLAATPMLWNFCPEESVSENGQLSEAPESAWISSMGRLRRWRPAQMSWSKWALRLLRSAAIRQLSLKTWGLFHTTCPHILLLQIQLNRLPARLQNYRLAWWVMFVVIKLDTGCVTKRVPLLLLTLFIRVCVCVCPECCGASLCCKRTTRSQVTSRYTACLPEPRIPHSMNWR